MPKAYPRDVGQHLRRILHGTDGRAVIVDPAHADLGQQPPQPSWGSMLNTAQRFLSSAPWMAIFPGLAIFVTVLSFNLLGDGLRDALDPRTGDR